MRPRPIGLRTNTVRDCLSCGPDLQWPCIFSLMNYDESIRTFTSCVECSNRPRKMLIGRGPRRLLLLWYCQPDRRRTIPVREPEAGGVFKLCFSYMNSLSHSPVHYFSHSHLKYFSAMSDSQAVFFKKNSGSPLDYTVLGPDKHPILLTKNVTEGIEFYEPDMSCCATLKFHEREIRVPPSQYFISVDKWFFLSGERYDPIFLTLSFYV